MYTVGFGLHILHGFFLSHWDVKDVPTAVCGDDIFIVKRIHNPVGADIICPQKIINNNGCPQICSIYR